MRECVMIWLLGFASGVLSLLACQERQRMKRQLGYPRRAKRTKKGWHRVEIGKRRD